MIEQATQLIGALLCLLAFILAQFGIMTTAAWSYVLVNFFGSGMLAIDALIEKQWGFLLMEGVWALVSFWSIVTKLRGMKKAEAV